MQVRKKLEPGVVKCPAALRSDNRAFSLAVSPIPRVDPRPPGDAMLAAGLRDGESRFDGCGSARAPSLTEGGDPKGLRRGTSHESARLDQRFGLTFAAREALRTMPVRAHFMLSSLSARTDLLKVGGHVDVGRVFPWCAQKKRREKPTESNVRGTSNDTDARVPAGLPPRIGIFACGACDVKSSKRALRADMRNSRTPQPKRQG